MTARLAAKLSPFGPFRVTRKPNKTYREVGDPGAYTDLLRFGTSANPRMTKTAM
jgi:hypothetical protein